MNRNRALKISGGILAFIILAALGLRLYFNDARLKRTVMPHLNEAVGREVQVESMSLTFFSTFPQPGLSISGMSVPGGAEGDTLLSLDRLTVGVHLFSLLGDEISISEIGLRNPEFTYEVYEDSTSNLDFLLGGTEEDTAAAGYAVNVPYFEVSDGQIGYLDRTSDTWVNLRDLDANISLRYAGQIESRVEIELGGLYATVDSVRYAGGLPISLSQESMVDLDRETVNLKSGTFSIRGLTLNLAGSVNGWSDSTSVDLAFDTSSDNLDELLQLVPEKHRDFVEGLETRGSLAIEGTVKGRLGGEQPLAFDTSIRVADGYIKNPELPRPVEKININARATNERLSVTTFSARAGDNTVSAKGSLADPLSDESRFSLQAAGMADLATVNSFYDVGRRFGIEELRGQLEFKADARGLLNRPAEADFSGSFTLSDGYVKYREVPRAIDHINIEAGGNQDEVTVNSLTLNAGPNAFSMEGSVGRPLAEEQRTVSLQTNLQFDLSTIKDFYPINEDTLSMEGMLTAQAALEGSAHPIEEAVQSGSINLKNGRIDYHRMDEPLRNITFESVLEGRRMTIVNAGFRSGDNRATLSGIIDNYLGDDRILDLKVDGFAQLSEIGNYYRLEPMISSLTGNSELKLRARGQLDKPADMDLEGALQISDMNMEGDSLAQPVSKLNGRLELTPDEVTLEELKFNFGSSDISLGGTLTYYMEFLEKKQERQTTPTLEGSYQSSFLDVDEIIDWEDSSVSIPIYLPELHSSVTATVDKMIVTGVTLQNLQAEAEGTPERIQMNEGSAELFEGEMKGSFTWEVPQPDHTNISFTGSLSEVRAEAFFSEYPVMGRKSNFHNYISGSFNASVEYFTELDVFLNPLIETTKSKGNFGMSKARLKGHPLQEALASMLKADELRNIALDKWTSTFTIENSVLTFKNLSIKSGNIGVEMSGSQHLVNETLDYKMQLHLPGRFKKAIASVITTQAANALEQEDGTILVPFRVTGTMDKPKIQPDKEAIKPILQKYLKDKAGNVLKKLFDNGL